MRRRSTRFVELVERQLDLFATEQADLIRETGEALARYNGADRDDAEELYGDYQDCVDAGVDALLDIREAYAAGLDGNTDDEYRNAFDERVRRRFPTYALGL